MKIIFYTNKCSHGAEILKAIKRSGIKISAIIIEKMTIRSTKEKIKRITQKGYRELFFILIQKIKQRFISKSMKIGGVKNTITPFQIQ